MSAHDDFSLHDDEELSLHDDASLAGSVPATNKEDAPAKPPQIITTNTLSNIKLPVLQKDDYDTWAMEMEHYLEYIDNEVWKVIQNGNSKKRVTKGKDGVYRVLPPTTQEEQFADEKERKARTLLLMAVPKDHLRRFHGMDDAKEIWAAIKTRFGVGWALVLSVSDEDANHKFLRSLPPCVGSLAYDNENEEPKPLQGKHKPKPRSGSYSSYTHFHFHATPNCTLIAMTAIRLEVYKKTGRRARVDGKMHMALIRELLNVQLPLTGILLGSASLKVSKEIQLGRAKSDEELNHALMAFTVIMSSTVKIGLGYGIKSNAEVLGYEEEISRGIFAFRETDAGNYDIPLYSRFKQFPLVYSKTCQSNDSDGEQGTVSDHSVNDDPIPIPSIEQVTIATQKTQPQVPKPQQTVDPSCAQLGAAFMSKVFIDTVRATPPGLTLTGSVSSAGTQFKSGASRFNTGKQHGKLGSAVKTSAGWSSSDAYGHRGIFDSGMLSGNMTGNRGLLEDYQNSPKWDLLLLEGSIRVSKMTTLCCLSEGKLHKATVKAKIDRLYGETIIPVSLHKIKLTLLEVLKGHISGKDCYKEDSSPSSHLLHNMKVCNDLLTLEKSGCYMLCIHLGTNTCNSILPYLICYTGSINLNTAFEEVNTGNTEAISPSADHEEEVFSDADDDEMPRKYGFMDLKSCDDMVDVPTNHTSMDSQCSSIKVQNPWRSQYTCSTRSSLKNIPEKVLMPFGRWKLGEAMQVELNKKDERERVCKACMDLHQAPRAWYATLSTFLEKHGYKRGTIDKTLFIRRNKNDIMLVQVYVDDIIFGSHAITSYSQAEQGRHLQFKTSIVAEISRSLILANQNHGIMDNPREITIDLEASLILLCKIAFVDKCCGSNLLFGLWFQLHEGPKIHIDNGRATFCIVKKTMYIILKTKLIEISHTLHQRLFMEEAHKCGEITQTEC
ncbi:ribonuclease H-like domain-containing protein [Tanacetum coccineum]